MYKRQNFNFNTKSENFQTRSRLPQKRIGLAVAFDPDLSARLRSSQSRKIAATCSNTSDSSRDTISPNQGTSSGSAIEPVSDYIAVGHTMYCCTYIGGGVYVCYACGSI